MFGDPEYSFDLLSLTSLSRIIRCAGQFFKGCASYKKYTSLSRILRVSGPDEGLDTSNPVQIESIFSVPDSINPSLNDHITAAQLHY